MHSSCIPDRFGSTWEEATLAPGDEVELSMKVFTSEGEIGVGLVFSSLHCSSWSTMLISSTSLGKQGALISAVALSITDVGSALEEMMSAIFPASLESEHSLLEVES